MADSKAGSFLVTADIATTEVSVTGVGFEPDAVLFWWASHEGQNGFSSGSDGSVGYGFMSSATQRASLSGTINEGAAANVGGFMTDEAAIAVCGKNGAAEGSWDFSSMDADGFTLVVDTAMTDTEYDTFRVSYLALKGSGTPVVLDLVSGTSTGNVAFTGAGFEPKAIIFMAGRNGTAALPAGGGDAWWSYGWATEALGDDMVTTMFSESTGGSSNNGKHGSNTACLHTPDSNNNDIEGRATLASMDADGFTLNFAEATSSTRFLAICFDRGAWVSDEDVTVDNASTMAQSGFGFAPLGTMLMGIENSETSADSFDIHCNVCYTAFSATDEVTNASYGQDDGEATSIPRRGSHDDGSIGPMNENGDSFTWEMSVTSIDSDGFTLTQEAGGGGSEWWGYLSFGLGSKELISSLAGSSTLSAVMTRIRSMIGTGRRRRFLSKTKVH